MELTCFPCSKKDGSTRFYVDYRRLHSIIRKNSYPIPWVDDAPNALSCARSFSTLDLRSGYHQVEVDPNHAHIQLLCHPLACMSSTFYLLGCVTRHRPSSG